MDEALVRRFAPQLRFARGENFYPMRVEEFVAQCSLHKLVEDRGDLYIPPQHVKLDYLGESDFTSNESFLVYAARDAEDESKARIIRRLIEEAEETRRGPEFLGFLKDEFRKAAMRMVGSVSQAFPLLHLDRQIFERALGLYGRFEDHSPAYYASVSEDAGYKVIQYWYFYAYNDFGTSHGGVNDHEGDWESVHVFLKDGQPVYAVYSAHGGHGELARRGWEELELDGDHPVVYVAPGSHANYFTNEGPETFALGEVTIGGSTGAPWGDPQPLDRPWFTAYKGRWGTRRWDSKLQQVIDAKSGAPTGPVFERSGDFRSAWAEPAKYAGLTK